MLAGSVTANVLRDTNSTEQTEPEASPDSLIGVRDKHWWWSRTNDALNDDPVASERGSLPGDLVARFRRKPGASIGVSI